MTNAFTTTGPSAIKLKQKSLKQMRQDATRTNRMEPLCAKHDNDKTQKMLKAAI